MDAVRFVAPLFEDALGAQANGDLGGEFLSGEAGHFVAIKIATPDKVDPELLARFTREARLAKTDAMLLL